MLLFFVVFVCRFGKDVATKPAKTAAVGIQGRFSVCLHVVFDFKNGIK